MGIKENLGKAIIKTSYFKAGEVDGENGNVSIVPHYIDKLYGEESSLNDGDREKAYMLGYAKGQSTRIGNLEKNITIPETENKNKNDYDNSYCDPFNFLLDLLIIIFVVIVFIGFGLHYIAAYIQWAKVIKFFCLLILIITSCIGLYMLNQYYPDAAERTKRSKKMQNNDKDEFNE